MSDRPTSRHRPSVRMFESSLLESLSKIPFYVPLLIFVPLFALFTWKAFAAGVGVRAYLGCFLAGLLTWSATEYFLHRYLFHWLPPGKLGARMHFIFHGVHHEHPNDPLRLVMPPSVSVPLAFAFYSLFAAVLNGATLYATFAGFTIGYLIYDTLHYAVHHHAYTNPLFKRLKRNHMQHHFVSPQTGYGVSSPLWDVIMGTRRKAAPPASAPRA